MLERLDGLVDGIAHPELGEASLVATHIESGPDILHTIQDHCRLTLDRRLMPGEDPAEALAAISRALSDMEPWQVEVTQGAFMYPADVPANSEGGHGARCGARDGGERRVRRSIFPRRWTPAT